MPGARLGRQAGAGLADADVRGGDRASSPARSRVLGEDHPLPWREFEANYDTIRDRIARTVPGCEDYNRKVREPDGFVLPHGPRDERRWPTRSGRAEITVNELEWPRCPPGRLLLQTVRSHDQFNTTIYGSGRPLSRRTEGPSGRLRQPR